MLIRSFFLFSLFVVLSGCNYFQPATEAQCETLYDHIVALSSESGLNNPNNGQIDNDLLNSFSSTGLDLVLNLTGEKEKILRRCSTTLNQMEVSRCIDTKTKQDWKNDCSFKIE